MHSSTIILSSLTHFENENQAKGTQIPLRLGKLKKQKKQNLHGNMGRAWDFAEDSVVDVIGKKRSLHSKLHRPFLLSLFLCSLLYLIRLPSRRRKASPSFPAFFLSIVSINSFLRLEFSCFSCSFLTVYIVCECRLLGFHISFLKLI